MVGPYWAGFRRMFAGLCFAQKNWHSLNFNWSDDIWLFNLKIKNSDKAKWRNIERKIYKKIKQKLMIILTRNDLKSLKVLKKLSDEKFNEKYKRKLNS